MTTKSREGKPNPDAAIVWDALKAAPIPNDDEHTVWHYVHWDGLNAHQIAEAIRDAYPAFAQALREGIAARRGQRFGGHGGR